MRHLRALVVTSASSQQHPHRLGQSDHCDLGRDGNTQHGQGIKEACGVRTACASLIYFSESFEQSRCWANLAVMRIHDKSKSFCPDCLRPAAQGSRLFSGVSLTTWRLMEELPLLSPRAPPGRNLGPLSPASQRPGTGLGI